MLGRVWKGIIHWLWEERIKQWNVFYPFIINETSLYNLKYPTIGPYVLKTESTY